MPLSSIKTWKCWESLKKIARTFRILKHIARWIALIDALFGIIVLVLIITTRSIDFHEKSHSLNLTTNQKIGEIIRLIILALRGAQLIFALILFEGARREIPSMVKAWLIYLLLKIIFDLSAISIYLTSDEFDVEHFYIHEPSVNWKRVFQVCTVLYNILQCLVILIFYNHLLRKEKRRNSVPNSILENGKKHEDEDEDEYKYESEEDLENKVSHNNCPCRTSDYGSNLEGGNVRNTNPFEDADAIFKTGNENIPLSSLPNRESQHINNKVTYDKAAIMYS